MRGRGGAGFPTARKWRGVLDGISADDQVTVVVNAAEGEPGTFKDRALLRANPYLVLEGALIAAHRDACRSRHRRHQGGVCLRADRPRAGDLRAGERRMVSGCRRLDRPRARSVPLRRGDRPAGGDRGRRPDTPPDPPVPVRALLDRTPARLVGRLRHRRIESVHWSTTSRPTAHVALVMRHGAEWYRSLGTPESPGPTIVTITGDVRRPVVAEIELGRSLAEVIGELAGGVHPGRRVKAVLSGVSNPVLHGDDLDVPITYEALSAAGGGLGSAGFIVYDDTRNMVDVAHQVSRFLHVESCGQCNACKGGHVRHHRCARANGARRRPRRSCGATTPPGSRDRHRTVAAVTCPCRSSGSSSAC